MSPAGARRYGLLTERQYTVLKMRLQGMTQEEVSRALGTSRSNVSIIEKKAWRNIRLAEETLRAYRELMTVEKIVVRPSTHTLDIPKIVFETADRLGVRLRTGLAYLQGLIHLRAGDCIEKRHVVKTIHISILRDGDIDVYCEDTGGQGSL